MTHGGSHGTGGSRSRRKRKPPSGSLSARQTDQTKKTSSGTGFQVPQVKEFGGTIKKTGGGFQVPQVKEFGGDIRTAEGIQPQLQAPTGQQTGFQLPEVQEFGGDIQAQLQAQVETQVQNQLQNIPGLQDFTGEFDRPQVLPTQDEINEFIEAGLSREQVQSSAFQGLLVLATSGRSLLPKAATKVPILAKALKGSVTAGVVKKGASAATPNIKSSGIIQKIFTKQVSKITHVTTTNAQGVAVTKTIESLSRGPRWSVGMIGAAIVGTLIAAKWVVEQTYVNRNFANFIGREEAGQGAGMSAWIAGEAFENSDDPFYYEKYLEAREIEKQAIAFDAGLMPIKNTQEALEFWAESAKRDGEITDEVMKRQFDALQNGTDPDTVRRQERAAERKAFEDAQIRQDERKRAFLEFELGARDDARKARDKEERRIMEQQAAFWAKQRLLEEERARQERIEIAKFWADYRAMKARITQDNTPSALVFGLL